MDMKRIARCVAILIIFPLVAAGQVADFEDLGPGTQFAVNDHFRSQGVNIFVEPFVQSGKPWGHAHHVHVVDAPSNPLGTGQAVYLDPANLRFEFGGVNGLSLRFAEHGLTGRNIKINGQFHEFARMQDIHGAVFGGVRVTITSEGARKGILELTPAPNPIKTFALGGFELYIDDVGPIAPDGPEIYFANMTDSTVYRYRQGGAVSPFYTRSAPTPGYLNYFEFAPWDSDRLFYVDSARDEIYHVDLVAGPATETAVHTHVVAGSSEQIRCLAFDLHGNLYLSDLDRLGASLGRIWRLDASSGSTTATLIWTVKSDDTGWSTWNGHFVIGPDETLYVSGGNLEPASIFRADLASGTATEVFHDPAGSVCGMAFDPDGRLYYADARRGEIRRLDLSSGVHTLVLATGTYVSDVGFRIPAKPQTPSPRPWVLFYGIHSVPVDHIKMAPLEGVIDYTDATSQRPMKDAPFGGCLCLQINASSDVPTLGTGGLFYYRILYRHESWATGIWKEITANLDARYVSQLPGQLPTFPKLSLGPKKVAGKSLYRFLPHESDLPALVGPLQPGEHVSWPNKPFPGDEFEGFFDTVALGLVPGVYHLRLEVYDVSGIVTPGHAYDFLIPSGASGTQSPAAVAGDYSFPVRVDNRPCFAYVNPPTVGGAVADLCGFLRYRDTTDLVNLAWQAKQPDRHAVYTFSVNRGPTSILTYADDVSSSAHNGDQFGNFFEALTVSGLLTMNHGSCSEAAFNASLYVLAKATTGNGRRINAYDAHANFAFALAPQ